MKQILHKGRASWQAGFTLVELLIVIALIAILSVAVLATINPVEQANKAKDSTMMNDSGEVLNAVERYYASNMANAQYPWSGYADAITNDEAVIYHSNQSGFGLCNSAGGSADDSDTECSYSAADATTRGMLIVTTELKDSFLQKGYSATANTFDKQLFMIKRPVAEGNSIYVCFVPKATANRKNTAGLRKVTVTEYDNYTFVDAEATDFGVDGNPTAAWTFDTLETSLLKCVP